jgi:hypothetical protein
MASSLRHDHGHTGAQITQGELSRSTEGPTAQQWAEHKEIIRELYSRRPLKEVRAILEQRFGFKAT